jgi:response regulator RpfG family c-di-GMP phosphodiesterase
LLLKEEGMQTEHEPLTGAAAGGDAPAPSGPSPWKVLVVDDDDFVHQVTDLVLQGYSFQGRGLGILHATSAAQARHLLGLHPDIAVILLDVVMETPQAGLELVRVIREEMQNTTVRIILRTGQPGRVPERSVIFDYDINDYKHKAELSELRLMTSLTAALRSYEQIHSLAQARDGLAALAMGTSRMLALRTLEQFAAAALDTVQSLAQAAACRAYCAVGRIYGAGMDILAASQEVTSAWVHEASVHLAACPGPMAVDGAWFVARFPACSLAVIAQFAAPPAAFTRQMLDTLSMQLALALDNLLLHQEVTETQGEIVATLGEVVETRSKETAHHVRLVAETAALLAHKAGLGREDVELVRRAAPMHDVGKIGIPDAVLLKPARLSPEEFALVQRHTLIGHAILAKSSRRLLRAAANIALEHHERWDGTGYPNGLAGEAIHIFGRLTALADVFDALMSPRVYKPAWPLEEVLDYLREQQGRQFDPTLVDLFLADVPVFLEVRQRIYADKPLDGAGNFFL